MTSPVTHFQFTVSTIIVFGYHQNEATTQWSIVALCRNGQWRVIRTLFDCTKALTREKLDSLVKIVKSQDSSETMLLPRLTIQCSEKEVAGRYSQEEKE